MNRSSSLPSREQLGQNTETSEHPFMSSPYRLTPAHPSWNTWASSTSRGLWYSRHPTPRSLCLMYTSPHPVSGSSHFFRFLNCSPSEPSRVNLVSLSERKGWVYHSRFHSQRKLVPGQRPSGKLTLNGLWQLVPHADCILKVPKTVRTFLKNLLSCCLWNRNTVKEKF